MQHDFTLIFGPRSRHERATRREHKQRLPMQALFAQMPVLRPAPQIQVVNAGAYQRLVDTSLEGTANEHPFVLLSVDLSVGFT